MASRAALYFTLVLGGAYLHTAAGSPVYSLLEERAPEPVAPKFLVPSKRAPFPHSLQRREEWNNCFEPQNKITAFYGAAEHLAPAAHIAFTAHPGRPILLLEDLDEMVHSVRCHSTVDVESTFSIGKRDRFGGFIDLEMASEDAFEVAFETWQPMREVVVLTAHETCNNDAERGAWRVSGFEFDEDSFGVRMLAESIPLANVGSSFNVRYGNPHVENFIPRIARRQAQGEEDAHIFQIAMNKTFEPREEIFPAPGLEELQLPAFKPIFASMLNTSLQAHCVGCSLTTAFTIAMDFDVDVADGLGCVTDPSECFTITSAHMNLTVDKFEQIIGLEISAGESLIATSFTFDTPLKVPLTPFAVPGVFALGPQLGASVSFELDFSGAVNFTAGAKATIPQGATATFNLLDGANPAIDPSFSSVGWGAADVEALPLRLNSGEFNLSAAMAFTPFAEVGITVGPSLFTSAARINVNTPKVHAEGALVAGVNRQCEAVGIDDFESFSSAVVLSAGVEVAADAQLIFEAGTINLLPEDYTVNLFKQELPLLSALGLSDSGCFIIDAGEGVPAPSGTVLAASAATPTFDVRKIEEYYSAQGSLPPNVNYDQLLRSSQEVPEGIRQAVEDRAEEEGNNQPGNGAGFVGRPTAALFVVLSGSLSLLL